MHVAVDGAELWVEEKGRGPAVVVPSGAGSEFYRRTFPAEVRRALRLIYVDMRQTGQSTGSMEGVTFASMADDVDAVRRALGLERIAVMGHSNHAGIALEYGLRHAASTHAIVAVGGVPDFTRAFALGMQRWQAEASAERQAALARRQAEFAAVADGLPDDERAVRQYCSIAPLGWRDPDFDPWPLWGAPPRGVAVYLPWIAQVGTQWNFVPRLGELRAPVLAVCGRWDYLCPIELWQESIAVVPDARLEIFENSAHNPQYEEPERFTRLLTRFLANAS